MHFTDKYIKMCQEAKEIQEVYSPKAWDYNYIDDGVTKEVKVLSGYETDAETYGPDPENSGYVEGDNETRIFLPLQHQLQEMVRGVQPDEGLIINDYGTSWEFVYNITNNYYLNGVTLEECWLRILMLFRYNKKWNNTEEVWEC